MTFVVVLVLLLAVAVLSRSKKSGISAAAGVFLIGLLSWSVAHGVMVWWAVPIGFVVASFVTAVVSTKPGQHTAPKPPRGSTWRPTPRSRPWS